MRARRWTRTPRRNGLRAQPSRLYDRHAQYDPGRAADLHAGAGGAQGTVRADAELAGKLWHVDDHVLPEAGSDAFLVAVEAAASAGAGHSGVLHCSAGFAGFEMVG